MKKGRPGHVLHVLTDATLVEVLRAEIQRVTGTMGIRATAVERWPVARELEQVAVDGITIRMKVISGRAKPEFDDVALAAAKTGHRPTRWPAGPRRPGEPPVGRPPLRRIRRPDGERQMFHYDEAMTDLVLAACRERLSMDPVALDFGGLVESLDAELAGLMRPEGNDAADVLQLFVDKLSTAVVSCDSPRFLSFIPAAPTKASLLFDMFVSCSSLHGTSWLEAAGVVVAENQALGVLAAQAGLPDRSRRLLRGGRIGRATSRR